MKSKVFRRLKKFLIEVEVEMKKVSWTTRKELIASTSVVVIATLLIALFVFLVDTPLSKLIELIIR
ncbi:preprotein translocase subunit SecE [candidate division NPL-UPA2 bacterium]|nr:preprotein translocase subunit SecE [candidate division NPL-UPA2 bacterium]